MIKLVNLCPHEIKDINSGTLIPQTSKWARCKNNTMQLEKINGIDIYDIEVSSIYIEDKDRKKYIFPEEKKGIMYIISALCGNAKCLQGRNDILVPGSVVKENGVVKGCRGLRKI